MGDRAMLKVVDGDYPPLYMYTHWHGSDLADQVQRTMDTPAAKSRVGDGPYLARVVFCHLVSHFDEVLTETGWGLSTHETDGRVVATLDVNAGTVSV